MSVSATFTNLVHTLRVATSFQIRESTLTTLVDDVLPNITLGQLKSSGFVPILFDVADPATDTLDVSSTSATSSDLTNGLFFR